MKKLTTIALLIIAAVFLYSLIPVNESSILQGGGYGPEFNENLKDQWLYEVDAPGNNCDTTGIVKFCINACNLEEESRYAVIAYRDKNYPYNFAYFNKDIRLGDSTRFILYPGEDDDCKVFISLWEKKDENKKWKQVKLKKQDTSISCGCNKDEKKPFTPSRKKVSGTGDDGGTVDIGQVED